MMLEAAGARIWARRVAGSGVTRYRPGNPCGKSFPAWSGLCVLAAVLAALLPSGAQAQSGILPIADVHIHYSHDAWEQLPPPKALEALREAGLKKAFVSSSSDEGTQKLYALAPDFIVPVLRPYRRRGEISTWLQDDTVPSMLAGLLAKNRYAGIGEFHVFGKRADGPVMQEVVRLARRYGLFLHAHSDADGVCRQSRRVATRRRGLAVAATP